jgi:hypothetical protein
MHSYVAGSTGMHHQAWLIDWDGGLYNSPQGWLWIVILLISASQVAGITDMCHHTQPLVSYVLKVCY